MDCKLDTKPFQVCRTCMEEISTSSFFCLNSTQADTQLTIKQKLSYCIPELDLNLASNSIICDKCAESINSVYDFKNKCLQSELQTHKYMQQVQHIDDIDLAEVACFHQPYLINLSELKTEVLEIKDDKIEECTGTVCNANAFNETEEYVQRVAFYTDENYVNYNILSAEANSHTYYNNSNCVSQVDCIKNMPQSRAERLRKKREAERRRYERIKQNPVLLEEDRNKRKVKYANRKTKKQIKSISEKTSKDKKATRKKWIEAARKYRAKLQQQKFKEEWQRTPTGTLEKNLEGKEDGSILSRKRKVT